MLFKKTFEEVQDVRMWRIKIDALAPIREKVEEDEIHIMLMTHNATRLQMTGKA